MTCPTCEPHALRLEWAACLLVVANLAMIITVDTPGLTVLAGLGALAAMWPVVADQTVHCPHHS